MLIINLFLQSHSVDLSFFRLCGVFLRLGVLLGNLFLKICTRFFLFHFFLLLFFSFGFFLLFFNSFLIPFLMHPHVLCLCKLDMLWNLCKSYLDKFAFSYRLYLNFGRRAARAAEPYFVIETDINLDFI